MQRVLPAGLAKFLQLQPRFDGLLILRRMIVDLFTLGALEFNKGILRHILGTRDWGLGVRLMI